MRLGATMFDKLKEKVYVPHSFYWNIKTDVADFDNCTPTFQILVVCRANSSRLFARRFLLFRFSKCGTLFCSQLIICVCGGEVWLGEHFMLCVRGVSICASWWASYGLQ